MASTTWNDGRAGFIRSDQLFRISERHGMAVGDFDSDGLPDIFASAYSDTYRVWFNQGDRTFGAGPGW